MQNIYTDKTPFSIWKTLSNSQYTLKYRSQNNSTFTENSHHLLTAVNAVQSLLQLSKGIALQALSSFFWDRGQRLPKKWLRGLRKGLRGATRLALWLRLHRNHGEVSQLVFIFNKCSCTADSLNSKCKICLNYLVLGSSCMTLWLLLLWRFTSKQRRNNWYKLWWSFIVCQLSIWHRSPIGAHVDHRITWLLTARVFVRVTGQPQQREVRVSVTTVVERSQVGRTTHATLLAGALSSGGAGGVLLSRGRRARRRAVWEKIFPFLDLQRAIFNLFLAFNWQFTQERDGKEWREKKTTSRLILDQYAA